MKRTLIFLLAASLFLVTPALAAAARGEGHGGGPRVVSKEKVVIYKTTQQRDHRYDRSDRQRYDRSDRHRYDRSDRQRYDRSDRHHYDRSDRRDYRQTRNYHRPPRHAPVHGYYKNHSSHRHQPKKVVRHHAPAPRNSVVIGVPSIIIRLGF